MNERLCVMNCEACEQSIYPYLDEQLEGEELREFEEALKECEECQQLLEEARKAREVFGTSEELSLSSERREAIMLAAHQYVTSGTAPAPEEDGIVDFPAKKVTFGLLAAVLTAGALGYWLIQNQQIHVEFERTAANQTVAANDNRGEKTSQKTNAESSPTSSQMHGAESPGAELRGAEPPAPAKVHVGKAENSEQHVVAANRKQPTADSKKQDSPTQSDETGNRATPQVESKASAGRASAPQTKAEPAPRMAAQQAGGATEEQVKQRPPERKLARREAYAPRGTRARKSRRSAAAGITDSEMEASAVMMEQRPAAAEEAVTGGVADRAMEAEESSAGQSSHDDSASSTSAPSADEGSETIEDVFDRLRRSIEMGELDRAIQMSSHLSKTHRMSSSQRAELYYLTAIAHRRHGDREAARSMLEHAVEQGTDTTYGRAAYRELQKYQ